MDIDEILESMSTAVDKDKKYLKGLFTKSKNELVEQFGEAIPEDRLMQLTLSKIGKQYGLSQPAIDKLINGDEEEDDDFSFDDDSIDIEDDSDDDGIITYDSTDDVPKPSSAWAEVMSKVPDPFANAEKPNFERTPSLLVELGPTYYLKVDLTEDPHVHEFEGKYGAYEKTAIKVYLQKVSDTDLYAVKYNKGDFAGQLAFVDGKKYTLWMDDKCMGFFKMFWMKHRGIPEPDDRMFTFKHTKKGNYNVWQFGLPK